MRKLYGVVITAQLILKTTETRIATVRSVLSDEDPPPTVDIRFLSAADLADIKKGGYSFGGAGIG